MGMCAQRRIRSFWASEWRRLGPWATHWAHSKDWSDCSGAKTDLSRRLAHMPFCLFCHGLVQFFILTQWVYFPIYRLLQSSPLLQFFYVPLSDIVIITKTRLFKYIESFTSKIYKFSDKKTLFFFLYIYFCSKHRLWVLVWTASTRRF